MFQINMREKGKVLVVALRGEMDQFGANNLSAYIKECVLPKKRSFLIFDCTRISSISYTAAQSLNNLFSQLSRISTIGFSSMNPKVQNTFRSTSFYEKITVFDELDKAIEDFSERATNVPQAPTLNQFDI